MKLGASIIFQNYFRAEKADWQLYSEDLALAEMVEPLGFDSLWGVEHHFSPYTMLPDVLQFLTYMAGRTRRVVSAPWWWFYPGTTRSESPSRSRCSTCTAATAN